MRDKTIVTFKITSATLTPQDLEARLGIKPDECWRAGDPRGTFAAIEKQHGYVLESKAPVSVSAEDHVKAMIQRLAPCAQKIGEIAPHATIQLTCELHRKASPSLYLDRDDLRWLGVMGARLDVDVFIIEERAPVRSEGDKKPASDS